MIRKARILVLVLACAAVPRGSWAGDNPTPSSSSIVSFRLRNGLRVYVEERHRLPLVGFTMAFAAGAQRQEPGTYGFAHLFEHMMFMGTKHIRKEQHDTGLDAVGALEDAYTSLDLTQYHSLAPSAELETVLWLESDRMGFLLEALTEERLEAQKNDVLNELRETVHGEPYGQADQRAFSLAFLSPHPYFARVIGLEDDIRAATTASVAHFFKTYYVPANAAVVIVGDVSVAAVRPLLEKYFGSLPRGPAEAPPSAPLPERSEGPLRDDMEGDVSATRVTFAWAVPPAFGDDPEADVTLDIVETLLADKRFGVVARRMMQDRHLLADVQCENGRYRLGGLFQCDLTLRDHVSPARVEAEFSDILSELAKSPPPREVAAARAAWRATTLRADQNYRERAKNLGWYAVMAGDASRANIDMAAHNRVTPEGVGRVVARCLLAGRRYVVTVTPRGKP
jgi:zinc protease